MSGLRLEIHETTNHVGDITENVTKLETGREPSAVLLYDIANTLVTTATGTITLTDASAANQFIDPNGADRTVNLPSAGSGNHSFMIKNVGSANTLTVKSGVTTVATILKGEGDFFVSSGTTWYALGFMTETQATLKTYFDTIYIPLTGQTVVCNGRLTLESGVPISAADLTAKATLYFTPYNGNKIALYSGGAWSIILFAETSLNISTYTDAKNYDIFAYNNSGTLAIEGLVWTGDYTRATALAFQDGVYVKSGDATRRYIGTIRTSAAGKCDDSDAFRGVYNYYNRVIRRATCTESTSHAYNGAYRKWNNSDVNNLLKYVVGVSEDSVQYTATGDIKAGIDGAYAIVAIYLNGGALGSALNCNNQLIGTSLSRYSPTTTGYNYAQIWEFGNNAGSTFSYVVFQLAVSM